MRKLTLSLALLAGLAAAPRPALAVGPSAHPQEKKEPFGLVDSTELEKQLAAKGSKVKVFDVNTNAFREANGVIPGAVQLTTFDRFSAFDLPDDKETPLVFYCVNSH